MCIPSLLSGQSFSECSLILDKEVYPNIQKYVDNLNIKQSLTTDNSQKIADDVFDIIAKVVKDKKLMPLFPPNVYITKLKNEKLSIYYLNTAIILFDSEQSIKNVCITSILVEKRFILYVEEKGKIEV